MPTGNNGLNRSATELMLQCLRRGDEQEKITALRGLDEPEWMAIVAAADRHGVRELLYREIDKMRTALAVPTELLAEMRRKYYIAAARNVRIYRELDKAIGPLTKAQIPVIILKGAHLAEGVYGNVALRGMGDIDLLVREEHLPQIDELFLENGLLPREEHRVIMGENIHFSYTLPNSGIKLDLHWRLVSETYDCKFDHASIWERAVPFLADSVVNAGRNEPELLPKVMAPPDLLIYSAAHTIQHLHYLRMIQFYDVFKITERYGSGIDWSVVADRCRQWNASRAVYVVLYLAQELLAAPISARHLAILRPPLFDDEVFAIVRSQLLEGDNQMLALLPEPLVLLSRTPRLGGKISLIFKRIFLPRPMMSRMYPASSDSWRMYLYYPLRVKDLLVKHGKVLWRTLRDDQKTVQVTKKTDEIVTLKKWLLSR